MLFEMHDGDDILLSRLRLLLKFLQRHAELSLIVKRDGWRRFRWVSKGHLDEEILFSLLALDRNLKGLTPFTMPIRIPGAGVTSE